MTVRRAETGHDGRSARRASSRGWALALAGCLVVAAGIPAAWALSRPGDDGVGVRELASAPSTPTSPEPSPIPPAAPQPAATPTAQPTTQPTAEPVIAPIRLRVADVGLDAAVMPVGVEDDGAMTIPREVDQVGWYRFGPGVGAEAGSTVVSGHVDSRTQGLGAMAVLREVDVGATVVVTGDDGVDHTYRVVGRESFDKQQLPAEDVFARTGTPRLTLITCDGPFVPELGGYRDNLVVTAVPVR